MENRLHKTRPKFLRSESTFAFVSLGPILAYMLIFVLLPVVLSLYYSFQDTQFDDFVGIDNYFEFLVHDKSGFISIQNTFFYALLRIPTTILLGFLVANTLNTIERGRSFLVFGFFAPYITNTVAFSTVFMYLYTNEGLFNSLLRVLDLPTLGFIRNLNQALPSIALMDAWKHIGFDVIILLAALKGIPSTLFEAARIDGASRSQIVRFIKLPLLQPTFLYLAVVLTIWTLQVFEPVFVMTQGGPLDTTRTIVFSIYEAGFINVRLGYASAISYILFVIIFVVTLIQLRVGRSRWEY
jgi:multiple sugar transport system permease protein